MIQRRRPSPAVPNSSPSNASPGRARASPVADQLLGRVIGFRDRREVGLGIDLQVMGAKPAHRDLVGMSSKLEGEGEIGVDPATLVRSSGGTRPTDDGAACWSHRCASPSPVSVSPPSRSPSWWCCRSPRATTAPTRAAVPAGRPLRLLRSRRDHRPPLRARRPPRPPATPPTSAAAPPGDPGTCGNQTDAIVAATKATDAQGLNARAGEFSVQACHVAASSPIWAAAQVVGNPGVVIPRYTVVLQRIGSLWNVMDVGESGHSGCDAPSEIRADLGLGC